MNNKRINGKVLAKLLTMYVDAINDGAVPNITSAWESVVDGEREKYFHKAKNIYSQKIKEIPTPKDETDFLNNLFELRQEAIETLNEGFKLGDESVDRSEQDIKIKELKLFIQKLEKDAFKLNHQTSQKYWEELVKNAFSSISVKLRNEGYTADNMEEMQFDVNSFTNMYHKQAVGPAKMDVFIEFMNTAIPKISKDVLTKEYMKQREWENRLNEAIKILQQKNKMLEDNIQDMENDHGQKQDILEELESKLKKATKQEKLLLEKAEMESKKRQELIDELYDQQKKN